ncbi:MAG: hypothetical protein HC881_01125 [Leptolyngbyaceae cyanobacterium SL_7_1]|nr:hypothetical protein [Leptolyngbyaceae cyanobacterium SL_7_1]
MQVWVVVDAELAQDQAEVQAMQRAIEFDTPDAAIKIIPVHQALIPTAVETLICPLTLELLDDFPRFWGTQVFQSCRSIEPLRSDINQLNHSIGAGSMWLPLVQTARGLLYGEVIERLSEATPDRPYRYVHLVDAWRQRVYQLGRDTMRVLAAPPATYLLQFGIAEDEVLFDRVLPFPGMPAIASLGTQTPDLFACHWRCLTRQPILDLCLKPPIEYRVLDIAH